MKKSSRRTGLSKQIGQAQADAERAIGRGYRATLALLPPRSRKAVRGLADQIGSTADELTARSRHAAKLIERRRQALQERVAQGVKTLTRRGEHARSVVERRGTALVTTVERRVAGLLEPLVRRLEIATARDVERLSRRIAQLERKRTARSRRAAA